MSVMADYPTDAEWVARVRAVGDRLNVLCDCGVPRGESEATDPRDRSVRLPHHFDCAAVEAWTVMLAHLRAVAADEGVRERVGRAVAKVDGFDDAPPGYDLLADAALAAFLATLAGERALPGVVGPDDEERASDRRTGGHIQKMTDPYGKDFK